MNTLFWIGVGIFIVGVAVRWYVRIRYYKSVRTKKPTDIETRYQRSNYRLRLGIGLAIETVGCVIALLAVHYMN